MYGLNGEIQLNIEKNMGNSYLDKVVEQIISETEVSNGEVYFPFFNGGFPRRACSPTKITSYLLYNLLLCFHHMLKYSYFLFYPKFV